MKFCSYYLSPLLFLPLPILADGTLDNQFKSLAKRHQASEAHIQVCKRKLSGKSASDQSISACLLEEKNLEHIEVFGRYIGLESPEVVGRFHMDRTFIENTPKNNGDINELIALLPGVQVSEDAYGIDSLQEIKAQEISISGGPAWQTGFFIDGMNYNSRQDPASGSRNSSNVNDVQGGVQTMNVNSQSVESITVYDNNIPAEYGNFSGGVVDVETRSAFDEVKESQLSYGYRGTRSSWGSYHTIINDGENDDNDPVNPKAFDEAHPYLKKMTTTYNTAIN